MKVAGDGLIRVYYGAISAKAAVQFSPLLAVDA